MQVEHGRAGTTGKRTEHRCYVVERGRREFRGVLGQALGIAPVVVLVVVGMIGCGSDGAREPVVSDSTYVAVMARLTLIQQELEGTAPERADSARREVLDAHRVDPEDLRRWTRRHGDDPERMAAIWRAVQEKVEALRERREASGERVGSGEDGPPAARPLPGAGPGRTPSPPGGGGT